jgi:hypothetical protein
VEVTRVEAAELDLELTTDVRVVVGDFDVVADLLDLDGSVVARRIADAATRLGADLSRGSSLVAARRARGDPEQRENADERRG